MKSIPPTLNELTSLRFFAAFYVVMFHTFDNVSGDATSFGARLLHNGYLGVDFFFILSGFILTHVYIDSVRLQKFNAGKFLLARFARLYPLHFVMLLLFVATYSAGAGLGLLNDGAGMNWAQLPYHVLALHAWGFTDSHSWNIPSWSISAELFAYLIFPILAFGALYLRPKVGLVLALALFVVAFLVFRAQGLKLTGIMYNFGILRIFFEFLIGMFTYLVFRNLQFSRPVVLSALTAAIVAVVVLAGLDSNDLADMVIVPLFAVIIFFAGHLALFETPTVLRSKPLIYLGEISYSTYMVHYYILLMSEKLSAKLFGAPTPWPVTVLALVAIWIASVLLYHGVEHPARDIIRKYGNTLLIQNRKQA